MKAAHSRHDCYASPSKAPHAALHNSYFAVLGSRRYVASTKKRHAALRSGRLAIPGNGRASTSGAGRPSLLAVLIMVVLGACSPGDDPARMRPEVLDAGRKPNASIAPLPQFKDAPVFNYQASDKRSPFQPPKALDRPAPQQAGAGLMPNPNRPRQDLEGFPLSTLTLVGILARGSTRCGLVQDQNGRVHLVRVGDYLGVDHGRVRHIGKAAIEIAEVVADDIGGWAERLRTLALAPKEGG